MGRPIVDLTDRKFGLWTVLGRAPNAIPGRPRWDCRCACGTERPVLGAMLRQGRSTSCGDCRDRAVDMTGQRFGHLTVVERDRSKPRGDVAWWIVDCDCGGRASVRGSVLRRGETGSCGCRRWPSGEQAHAWRGDEAGYAAIHQRMAREDPAALHDCSTCGQDASDWAYLGGCETENIERVGGYWLAFCPHPHHYTPLCRRCHNAEDRANPKGPGPDGVESWRYMGGGAA